MYPGTEDLLSIRDGDPVDAEARAAVDTDPALRAEVARLNTTRDRLRELPEFEPPPGVRAKVFAELETGSGTRRITPSGTRPPFEAGSARTATERGDSAGTTVGSRQLRFIRQARWPLRGAIAAAVAVIAVLTVRSLDVPEGSAPVAIVAGNPVSTANTPGLGGAAAYTSLTSESARLERMLNEIPYRPRLVNAGTATMISGLEDRIGQVDQVLMYTSVNGLQPEQTVALWQERVDLMNALLQVRYAEAQRFGF